MSKYSGLLRQVATPDSLSDQRPTSPDCHANWHFLWHDEVIASEHHSTRMVVSYSTPQLYLCFAIGVRYHGRTALEKIANHGRSPGREKKRNIGEIPAGFVAYLQAEGMQVTIPIAQFANACT